MKNLRLLIVAGLLLLASLACDTSGSTNSKTPGASKGPTVLFQDDFANTDSGWNRVRDANGNITDYDNGGYRILNNQPISHVWANPGLKFNDVRVDVDAAQTSGPKDNYYGVICRYKDGSNFYILGISSDGYYGIVKVKNGNLSLIGADQMQPSESIQQGEGVNHLSAECKGRNLTLWVNGTQLIATQDGDFSSGDVGLEVSTRQQGSVDILFTNFSVTKP
jgi:hypothetical protein